MEKTTRRDVLKTAAYVAPAILTFPVLPAAAKSGSERGDYKKKKDDDKHDYDDKKWKDYDDNKWKDYDGNKWKNRH